MLTVVATDPVVRYRGDTLPDRFLLTSDGTTPVDVTLYSARLTVNALKDPGVTDTPLFELTGATTGTPTDGYFMFEPSLLEADQEPGKYYYDIEITTPAGYIVTVAKGTYTFKQDIGK